MFLQIEIYTYLYIYRSYISLYIKYNIIYILRNNTFFYRTMTIYIPFILFKSNRVRFEKCKSAIV